MKIISIDLAGSETRNTGIAWIDDKIKTESVKSNKEILKKIDEINPKIIGIDGPLTLPNGRKDIENNNGIHFRECDLELRRRKIRFFPITLGPMRKLTKRSMLLKREFEEIGIKVKEIFPGGSLDLLGLPRKNTYAVNEFMGTNAKNVDESDAAIGLFTLWLDSLGLSNPVKDRDGEIILPNPSLNLGRLIEGEFKERIHRFGLRAQVNDKEEIVYMRDTGNMKEYLVPKNKIYLAEKLGGKYNLILKAVMDPVDKKKILADPHMDNKLVQLWLRSKGIIASGKEVKRNNSTFDLSWEDCIAEVKGSNMHLQRDTAAFPDVYSSRAERHFKTLGEIEGCRYLYFVAHFPARKITINPEFPKLENILKDSIRSGLKVKGLSTTIDKFNEIDYVIVKKEIRITNI